MEAHTNHLDPFRSGLRATRADEVVVDNAIVGGSRGSNTRESMLVFSVGQVRKVAVTASGRLTKPIDGLFVWFPLTDEELAFLLDVEGLTPR